MARRWLRAQLLAVLLLSLPQLAGPVLGAPNNALSNGSVTPGSGTTATTFTFSVQFQSDSGAAAAVTASVANRTVAMGLVAGQPDNGTFRGSATLPAGSWPVTFEADADRGNNPTLSGPTVTVTSGATPPPTAPPTPRPTAAPTPVPTPTPMPLTATPLPPTTPPSLTATPIGGSSPAASGFLGGYLVTPAPTRSADAAPAVARPEAAADELWTLLTGGLVAVTVLAFLAMVAILRSQRETGPDQPVTPVKFGPPPADE